MALALVAAAALLLVADTAFAVWIHFKYGDGRLSSTNFMEADRDLAADPRTPTKLRRRLLHPAQEWVARENVSSEALLVLLSREDNDFPTRVLPFLPKDQWERARSWIAKSTDSKASGSTIPQQVAKNLFTNGNRSAIRKVFEANASLAMWPALRRRRILELYINLIEFGPGIYGVCTASWFYFNKPPSQITRWEMATLVGLMPYPKAYTVYPTSPTVLFARRHADERAEGLRDDAGSEASLSALIDSTPDPAKPACSELPPTLRTRLADTTTAYGYPLDADDQWFWARLTRQYADGTLPAVATQSSELLSALASRVPYTPGADGVPDR